MSLALAEGAKVVAVLSLSRSDALLIMVVFSIAFCNHSDTLFLLSHPKLGWLFFLIRTIFKWYLKIVPYFCVCTRLKSQYFVVLMQFMTLYYEF